MEINISYITLTCQINLKHVREGGETSKVTAIMQL